MNDNTKIEVAREIMNNMIAKACKFGFNPENRILFLLLNEETEMDKFNFTVINKILNVYAPIVKRGS